MVRLIARPDRAELRAAARCAAAFFRVPRFWAACLALFLAPLAAADGKELKPKLGDIGGASYSEVAESREVCRKAVEGRIALCRLNTSFEDEPENRKYARCLPVFEWQAESCAAHFRRQAGACEGRGPARIEGFTRFGCTVAAKADEETAVAPADRAMQARARADIRSGPGTGHARIGVLEAGREVRVTGEAGAWLRIEAPDVGVAFVHASRLVLPVQREQRDPAADRAPICLGMSPGAACWQELADPEGCRFWYDYYNPGLSWAWSGACRAGVADGSGALTATSGAGSAELIGAFGGGRMQGLWIVRYADGRIDRGPYVDGRKHGRWVDRYADGRVDEGSYANGRKHGRWVDRYASGNSFEYEYRNGSVDGQKGVYVTEDGERHSGRWSGNCFLDGEGRLLVWRGDREACPPG